MAMFGKPLWRQKRDSTVPQDAIAPPATMAATLPEPTPDERRNGWTAQALAKFRAEADRATDAFLFAGMWGRERPSSCDTDYQVFGR